MSRAIPENKVLCTACRGLDENCKICGGCGMLPRCEARSRYWRYAKGRGTVRCDKPAGHSPETHRRIIEWGDSILQSESRSTRGKR